MTRARDIYRIVDLVAELFPDCRIWQQTQIGLNPEIWSFSLAGVENSAIYIAVDGEKCGITVSMQEFDEQKKHRIRRKPRHKDIVKDETPEEIALIICEHFIKVKDGQNET